MVKTMQGLRLSVEHGIQLELSIKALHMLSLIFSPEKEIPVTFKDVKDDARKHQ